MLGKLMKYEVKATARWFLPLYTAVLLFSVINRVLYTDSLVVIDSFSIKQILQVLSMLAYVILMVGIVAVTFVVVIQRFYKSLLGDEGYLMFTLPVQSWKHILNKLLIGMAWNLISGAVGFGSILIMLPAEEVRAFFGSFIEMKAYLGVGGFITIPLFVLFSAAFGILQMYAAIALGHLFNKHKLLASFGMYLGISTVFQFLSLLLMPISMNLFSGAFKTNTAPMPSQINGLLIILILFTAVSAAACFILTNQLLKKKLNLE